MKPSAQVRSSTTGTECDAYFHIVQEVAQAQLDHEMGRSSTDLLGGGIQPFSTAPEDECIPDRIKVLLIVRMDGSKSRGAQAGQTQKRSLHSTEPHPPR